MRRREFITVVGSMVAWPLAVRAQATRTYRVGALLVGNADADTFRKELGEELRKAGYVEGQNLVFEMRSAEGKIDQLPKLAAELVNLKVDVIIAVYTPCALAAKQATRKIPIVMLAGDPLGIGLRQVSIGREEI
jgi:putative tryptophan/tyrosine transport system substrate-binding protein